MGHKGFDVGKLERDLETAEAINKAQLRIEIAFWKCEDLVDAASMWAALEKTVSQSARFAIERHGGDYETVRDAVDRASLLIPWGLPGKPGLTLSFLGGARECVSGFSQSR